MPFGRRHPVVSLPMFVFLFPFALMQVAWVIWKQKIEVVNIHYPTSELCYFALCRKFLRFRLICSLHGAEVFPGGKPQTKYDWGLQTLLRHADCIVTPSADLRRKVLELFPEYQDKVLFIHNGIEVEQFALTSSKPSALRGRYILSVSAYKEQKALDVLIEAMKNVAQHCPGVKLVLVGEGTSLRRELELLAAKLGLSECIEFHGRKSQSEVAELIDSCEVFVLPSRFETFGIVILEAMACKRPVVVSSAGGMLEIVRNGHNGLVVKPEDPQALADALITLCDDSSLRSRFGQAGFEQVREHFHVNSMGKDYERAFGVRDRNARSNSPKVVANENFMSGSEPS
jgi:glycosyltransferase involved in cell wall biosynthesis